MEPPMTTRTLLPPRRLADTHSFNWANGEHSLTIGYYHPAAPAEVFINLNKSTGTELEAISRDGAILLSLALQHGCKIETIKHAITRSLQGEPRSVIGAMVDKVCKVME